MSVTIASIFRDSAEYVDRYMLQVYDLEQELNADVRLCIAEGDSEDGTHNALFRHCRARGKEDTLIKVDHHGPKYGSVDLPERWAQVAYVCNSVMDMLEPTGPVIYVESDLIWEPRTMVRLLDDLGTVEAVAPMSMKHGHFYDTWGHRGLDGQRFTYDPPYHAALNAPGDLVQIGSAGSCIAMRPEVAKVARFGDNDCVVGLGRSIRHTCGAVLWLDKRVAVFHP